MAEHRDLYPGGPDDFLFTTPQGSGLDGNHWRAQVWRPAVERAGLAERAPTPHDLRHSHVAHVIEVGWHVKAISSRLLGHTSIKTSANLYGHLTPDLMGTGLDALDAASSI